jgi:hypothetical protein
MRDTGFLLEMLSMVPKLKRLCLLGQLAPARDARDQPSGCEYQGGPAPAGGHCNCLYELRGHWHGFDLH